MRSLRTLICLVLLSLSFNVALAQNNDSYKAYFDEIEAIVKANSSKSLANHLFDKVEIKIDTKRQEYSKSQAEAVLKQFFQDNSADKFEFVHDGQNNAGGIIYAIGDYTTNASNYRLVMRAKKFKDSYKLYRIEFTKER